MHYGFTGVSQAVLVVKNPLANAEDIKHEFDLWVRKIPWRRAWQPTPRSCLENPMNRGDWQATVHSIAKSQTGLKHLCTAHTGPLVTEDGG